MVKKKLEDKLKQIEKGKKKLTIMEGYFGISIRANNDFAIQFLHPSK